MDDTETPMKGKKKPLAEMTVAELLAQQRKLRKRLKAVEAALAEQPPAEVTAAKARRNAAKGERKKGGAGAAEGGS